MMPRKRLSILVDFPVAGPEYLFSNSQIAYLERVRRWLGSDSAVVGEHLSKSCRFPLVRGARNVLLGYNLYDYVVFIPRATWRRLSSKDRASIARKQRMRWHPSYTDWTPGRGEVLLSGPEEMVLGLLRVGILSRESEQILRQLRSVTK